jgi:hypothetical protein
MATRSRRTSRRSGPRPPAHRFDEPGEYVIYSTPMFLLRTATGEELVRCPSRMVIATSTPITRRNGVRQVKLTLKEWEASGYSRLLGGRLHHKMARQLSCFVRGGSKAADLPGLMSISLRFDTYFAGRLVQQSRIGKAIGNISAFPPRKTDIFDISSKTFKVSNVQVQGIMCACSSQA